MISSTKNDQVKAVIELKKKAKARDEAGLFVVEGARMIAELPAGRAVRIYVSESYLAGGCAPEADGFRPKAAAGETKDRARSKPAAAGLRDDMLPPGVPCETVTDSVFRAMSDTQTPQGVLALVKQYRYTLDDLIPVRAGGKNPASPALLLILENLQDPGNLGTILRAGEGAGVTGVLMSRDTVDIYNPKVIRSTMGSVFRVPFCYTDDPEAAVLMLRERGVRIFAAHLAGACDYERADYTEDTGFLIGNEGNGLSAGITAKADTLIRIPMAGEVESLNAAVAASVLVFEAARQRRAKRS